MENIQLTGGAQAWAQTQTRAMSLTTFRTRLPAWRFDGLRANLHAYLNELRQEANLRGATYNTHHHETFVTLLEQIDQVSLAGIWTQAQHERATTPIHPIRTLSTRLRELRPTTFYAIDLLEHLGKISPADTAAIRRGNGLTDTANDLQALVPLLTHHWDTLVSLQEHMNESHTRLTLAMLEEIPETAAAYLSTKREQPEVAGPNWYKITCRLVTLLQRDWNQLRTLNVGALSALGRVEEALVILPPLQTIFRNR